MPQWLINLLLAPLMIGLYAGGLFVYPIYRTPDRKKHFLKRIFLTHFALFALWSLIMLREYLIENRDLIHGLSVYFFLNGGSVLASICVAEFVKPTIKSNDK